MVMYAAATPRPDSTATVFHPPGFLSFPSPAEEKYAKELPLNIIAIIISYLDDVGDLARLAGSSRLLHYMSAPRLYEKVTLRSYTDVRYVNGRPEGFGGGSPFMSGLNGLVTRSHAALVEEVCVKGTWREYGQDDFAKGRVPDNSMMLGMLLRAAVDKMDKLRSFVWELDCKPMKTLYQGLTMRSTLTKLVLKFPNSRVPRPAVMIPPIPSLRLFWALDIDPLCYPDDFSTLLVGSTRLEDLRIRFSPRMRRESEPSVSMATHIGRLVKSGQQLRLKHMGMQNLFGLVTEGMDRIQDPTITSSFTVIDNFGGIGTGSHNPQNIFIDRPWHDQVPGIRSRFKYNRTNEVGPHHLGILRRNEAKLERLYLPSSRPRCSIIDDAATPSPVTPESVSVYGEIARLGKEYLRVLTREVGASLQHLLLREEWGLTLEEVADVVRYCPNLEQLGMALELPDSSFLRLLMPFLPNLKAMRILRNESIDRRIDGWTSEQHREHLSRDLWESGVKKLKWLGVSNEVYECGRVYEHQCDDGSVEMRREIFLRTRKDAEHIAIFGLDNLDITKDPVAPFDP